MDKRTKHNVEQIQFQSYQNVFVSNGIEGWKQPQNRLSHVWFHQFSKYLIINLNEFKNTDD